MYTLKFQCKTAPLHYDERSPPFRSYRLEVSTTYRLHWSYGIWQRHYDTTNLRETSAAHLSVIVHLHLAHQRYLHIRAHAFGRYPWCHAHARASRQQRFWLQGSSLTSCRLYSPPHLLSCHYVKGSHRCHPRFPLLISRYLPTWKCGGFSGRKVFIMPRSLNYLSWSGLLN